MIFKVINGTFEEDFPDRSEVFYISRKQNKKLFFFLMDNFRDNTKVSYDFIKKELKRVGRE